VGGALQVLESMASCVFRVGQVRGDVNMPIREAFADGLEPCGNPGFAAVDLLATADQTDDHGPIRMTVHVRNEKFGLRLRKAGALLFARHEVGRHGLVPSALGLIEDDHTVGGRCVGIAKSVVAEVMHILDECLHFLLHDTFARSLSLLLGQPVDFVAGESFA